MSMQEKRYLDYEGLSKFFDNLKEYYKADIANDVDTRVGYSSKAGKLATPVNVSFSFGNMALGQLQNFDGSADGSVNLNLSDFALKSDVAKVLNFKGVIDYKKDLPDGTAGHERAAGDIYIVRYQGTEGTDEWGAEFIFDGSKWEEFGNTKVLDGYVTKSAFEEYQETVQGVADSLQAAIEAEAASREAGDIAVYNSILGIEDYRIRKLFHGETATTSTALRDKLTSTSLENGTVITLADNMSVDQLIVIDPREDGVEKNVTVEIPAGKTLTVNNERLFSVGINNGTPVTLELVGEGTIKMAYSATNDEPLIFVRGNNNLVIDGPHLINKNPENTSLIQTNGNQDNVNIVIKSGTFEGSLYLPAGGTTTIEGGEFKYGTEVLYCKSGTLNISGGKFNVTSVPDSTNGNWAHWNSGTVDMGSTIVIEACNYGGRGNPVVNITGGEFKAAPANDDSYVNYPILVIPYGGNNATMSGTTVDYQLANPVSGHVTVDGKTVPSDGWYKFNDSNTTPVVHN